MYGVNILLEEHDNILRFLQTLDRACIRILKDGEVDLNYFREAVDFIREYADGIHHGKEEDFLFQEMQDQLGNLGKNLIDHGMLVEHDLARYNVMSLEKALDFYEKNKSYENMLGIITYAMAYRDLLTRHIDKENRLVYEYAKKSLSQEALARVDEKTRCFQERLEKNKDLEKYTAILEEFETRYKSL